jgi:hypothetical protein
MTNSDEITRRAQHRQHGAAVARFENLEQENASERERRARMTPAQRRAEISAVLDRRFGPGWRTEPIRKVWSYEIVDWI